MPRDDYDDEDDRPRRRRRRDEDDDDDDRPRRKKKRREAPKSNTGLILGIVGGVLLLVVAGCGIGGYLMFKGAQTKFDELMVEDDTETVATQFLDHLANNQGQVAYDGTTDHFKQAMARPQFDALLKKHPLLTTHKDSEEIGVSKVTGAKPTRQRRMQYSLSPVPLFNSDDFDDEDEFGNPKPKKPKAGGGNTTQRLTVTLVVAETATGQWKVDSLTVP